MRRGTPGRCRKGRTADSALVSHHTARCLPTRPSGPRSSLPRPTSRTGQSLAPSNPPRDLAANSFLPGPFPSGSVLFVPPELRRWRLRELTLLACFFPRPAEVGHQDPIQRYALLPPRTLSIHPLIMPSQPLSQASPLAPHQAQPLSASIRQPLPLPFLLPSIPSSFDNAIFTLSSTLVHRHRGRRGWRDGGSVGERGGRRRSDG